MPEAKARRNLTKSLTLLRRLLGPFLLIEAQQEVLAAYEDLGDLLNIERTENNVGMSFLGTGHYSAALPHMQRAVELARQLGAQSSLANALDSLGTAYLELTIK